MDTHDSEDKSQEQQEFEKAVQEKYMELQMASNELKQMQAQLKAIDQQMIDLSSVAESLDELKASKVGKEMLVPISGGIFVKGILKDTETLIVNVGANVAVKKSVDETKQLLNKRLKETEEIRAQALSELENMAVHAHQLESELGEMIGQKEE